MQKITKWVFLICTLLFSTHSLLLADIDLELSMTADKNQVAIYKNITYTLTITNNGNETATGIDIEFPLPQNTAYTGSSTSKGNYVHWSNTWSINSLNVGETATMDLVAFTLSRDLLRMSFAEIVAADQTDSDSTPANNTVGYPFEDDEAQASAVGLEQETGDLRLAVSSNQTEFAVGDWVHYTLLLFNETTNTTGPFIVKANLPSGLQYKAFGGNGFFDAKSNVWVFPNELEGNGILAMNIYFQVVSLNQPTDIFFEIIGSTNPDSDSTPNNDNGDFTANEDDEVLTTISPYTGPNESDLELQVSVNVFPPIPASPSEPSTFEAFIILNNRGSANNRDISVDVELPEGIGNVEFVAPPLTAFNFDPNSTTQGTWFNQELANGGQDILLFTGTINDNTIPLTFYAEVRETPIPDPDSTPDNNSTQIPVEDDEGAFTISPSNGTRPDLEAFILEITPIAVQPGETIDVEFQVENVGGAAAPASRVDIWIDDFFDGNPYHSDEVAFLGTESISALGIDEKETLSRTYTVPNNLPAGQYWIYIKADSEDTIEEDIEANVSVYSSRLTVGGTLPNLYVRDVNTSPNPLVAGNTVTLSCEIFSNGEIPASASTLQYYFSNDPDISPDDILIGFDNVPLLEVGEGSQQSITYDLPPDLESNGYYFIFLADAQNIYTETNEIDNKLASLQFITGQQADLRIPRVRVVSLSQNTQLSLFADVTNDGFVDAPATTMSYYLSQDNEIDGSDIYLGDGAVASIQAGQTITIQQVFNIPPSQVPYGEYYVIWEVNPNQNVNESFYDNNTRSTRYTHVAPSNSSEDFLQYYGTGKGLEVEETATGYQILGRSIENTLSRSILEVTTDAFGNQTAIAASEKVLGKVIRTNDGGTIEVGSTSIPNTLLDPSDIYVVKRDELFNIQWTKVYNLGNLEYGTDIHQTADGGYVVTGSTREEETFTYDGFEYERTLSNMVVLRINSNGNQQWFNKYEMPPLQDDNFYYYEGGALITEMNNGNFAVLTSRGTPSLSAPPGLSFDGFGLYVYIIGATGDVVNYPEQGYVDPGAYYSAQAIKPTSDGGYVYVTNWQVSSSKSGPRSEAIKVGGSNPDWTLARSTSQFGTVRFNNVLENNQGNFIIMGIYQPFNTEPQYLIHVHPNLMETEGFDIDREACDMIQTTDNGYAFTGVYNDQIFLKKIPGDIIQPEGVDIELEYTVDEPTYRQWQKVDYTLTATNNGTETATNLVISDPIPFGMAFTSKVASKGTYNLWFQTWTIPDLAPGETATLDLTLFTLINNATIVKFAQVKSLDQTDIDSTPNNNNTTIPQEDDEAAVSIFPIGGGSGKDVLDNPIAQSGNLKLYQMFPVPANDVLNVVFGTGGFQVNVLLYDVNGRLLERKSLRVNQGENALQWDVSDLTSGFYTISIETPEGYVRGKFLKQ